MLRLKVKRKLSATCVYDYTTFSRVYAFMMKPVDELKKLFALNKIYKKKKTNMMIY